MSAATRNEGGLHGDEKRAPMGRFSAIALAWGAFVGGLSAAAGVSRSTAEGDLRLQLLLIASAIALPLGAVLGAASLGAARFIWQNSSRIRPASLRAGAAAVGPILVGSLPPLLLASTAAPGLLPVAWVPIAGACLGGMAAGAWLRVCAESSSDG